MLSHAQELNTHKTIIQLNLIEKGKHTYTHARNRGCEGRRNEWMNEFLNNFCARFFQPVSEWEWSLWPLLIPWCRALRPSKTENMEKACNFPRTQHKDNEMDGWLVLFCISNWLETKSIMLFRKLAKEIFIRNEFQLNWFWFFRFFFLHFCWIEAFENITSIDSSQTTHIPTHAHTEISRERARVKQFNPVNGAGAKSKHFLFSQYFSISSERHFT